MARWWCVASADPVSLQRVVAASLIGLLILAAFDPALAERSAIGQGSWLFGMFLAGLAWIPWRSGARAAAGTVLGIDSSATLYRAGAEPGTVVPIETAGLGAWRIGPWQFIRFSGTGPGPRVLAFDRRRIDAAAWAALQRALVRARRHRPDGPGAVPAIDVNPRPPRPDGGR